MRQIHRGAVRSVKLTVCCDSDTDDRPRSLRMKGLTHVGTGTADLDDQSVRNHPAYKAGQSFLIRTAAHVLYNTNEAKKTRVEFFLDDDVDRSNVVECRGVCLVIVREDLDWCEFICEAKDPESGRKIREKLSSFGRPTVPMSPSLDVAWTVSYPTACLSLQWCLSQQGQHPENISAKLKTLKNVAKI